MTTKTETPNWIIVGTRKGKRTYLGTTCWTLSKADAARYFEDEAHKLAQAYVIDGFRVGIERE